jgi:hypothetical protein
MLKKIKENFSPLLFLASLGAGGIAVAGFILIQYGGLSTVKGLATFATVNQTPVVILLEIIMVVFATIHTYLTILFLNGYFS